VIVRISNEAQFELDDSLHAKLDELDDAVVAAVDAGDEDRFHELFEELLQLVRTEGRVLEDDDLHSSDFILPPADLTFAVAGEEFTGEGLIPDPPGGAETAAA
jgi:hypothetical protein